MAEHEGDYMTMEELTSKVAGYLDVDSVPATSLSGPLQELRQKQYGEILTDVERPETGGRRVHNLTAFKTLG
jgi:hypothetical protein